MRFFLLILALTFCFACKTESNTSKPKIVRKDLGSAVVEDFEIVNTYKHDPKAFTQGLAFYNGFLYESTGLTGRSSIRKVDLETGKVLQRYDIAPDFFGEGMTILNNKIYQITWQDGLAWEYDLDNFKLLREFRYPGQGWGITNDGKNLIMSDGTQVLRVINPENFETIRTIHVQKDNGQDLLNINELEWIKGEIWANVWQDTVIARIDPESGKIKGWIDFASLVKEESREPSHDVLNGIAYDERNDRIFITGKLWKSLFEIKLKSGK